MAPTPRHDDLVDDEGHHGDAEPGADPGQHLDGQVDRLAAGATERRTQAADGLASAAMLLTPGLPCARRTRRSHSWARTWKTTVIRNRIEAQLDERRSAAPGPSPR